MAKETCTFREIPGYSGVFLMCNYCSNKCVEKGRFLYQHVEIDSALLYTYNIKQFFYEIFTVL